MTDPLEEAAFRSKLISGVKWAALVRIASQTFNWIVTLAMVRLLTPHDYGLNAMIEGPIELLFLFSTLGIDAAIIRFGSRDQRQLASAFGYLLLINIIFFVILFSSAKSIAEYFNEPQLTLLIQVASVIFVLAPFRTIPNALLDMELNFKLKSQVEFAASIISSITALTLAFLGAGIWALVSVMIVSAVVKVMLLAFYRPWIIIPSLYLRPIIDFVKYGFVIMAGGAIGVIAGRALTILTGPLIGTEVLGFFAVATVFSMLPMNKVMPIVQQAMFPAIAQLRTEPELMKKYLMKSLELTAYIIFPMAIGTACLSTEIVMVLFGEKWFAMSLPLTILAALSPIRLVNQIFHAPLNAHGYAKVVAGIQFISLFILAGGAIYVANFGIMGLVWLTALSVVISTIASVLISQRIFKIKFAEIFNAIKPALTGSLVMILFLLTTISQIDTRNSVLYLIANILTGVAVYLISVVWIFKSRIRLIQNAFFEK